MKIYLAVCFFITLIPALGHAERFQLGLGVAKQRLNTGSFQNSAGQLRGSFDFTSYELRGAFALMSSGQMTLSLEGQFHKGLESQKSTAGYIDFQEIAFNGTANVNIWNGLGAEVGLTVFSMLNSPKKEMENPAGVGVLYGITYLINEDFQLRLRREDKSLASSYDIQPGVFLLGFLLI